METKCRGLILVLKFLTPQVTPFVAADFDNENPYDNMSQHTTETTTKDGDDIISVKSAAGTKNPMPGKLDLICRLQLPKIRNFNCALKSKIL